VSEKPAAFERFEKFASAIVRVPKREVVAAQKAAAKKKAQKPAKRAAR
jgi:hypothetical protein